MGLTQFDIILDNPHRSYFSGQVVTGKVFISLDRPKKIQGVKLKLIGKAKTHWKETSGRTTTTATDEEDYIDEKVYLFGYESDGSESILAAGEHNYSFYFQLPEKIPSSFESRYGSVKYFLVTVMSRSLKSNFTVKSLFTVNGIFDLNEEWGSKHVGELSKQKQVCCLCCESGPITFNLKIPRVGFVPGENVPFVCEIINHSRRKVQKTSLSLIQNLTFRAGTKTKRKSITIHFIEGPDVQPGNEEIWKNNDNSQTPTGDSNETWRLITSVIRIPSIPPSRLGSGCRIIDTQYSLKMKLDIEDAASLSGHIPIIIGTIPLRSSNTVLPQLSPTISNQLQLPNGERRPSSVSSMSIPGYPDLPPPSYEEAVGQVTETEESDPPEYNTVVSVAFSKPDRFVPNYVIYKLDV